MADEERIPLQRLHVRLLKRDITRIDHALDDPQDLHRYELKGGLGFDGRLYLSPPNQGPPPWLEFVQTGLVLVCPAVLFSRRWKTCRSNWMRTVADKGRVSVARRNLKDLRQTTRLQPRLPKPGEPVGANPWRPDSASTGGRGIQRRPGGISRGCGRHGGTESSMTRGDLSVSGRE